MATTPITPVENAALSPTKDLTPVAFQHSPNIVALLEQLNLSVLISTYQAGKVISVGSFAGNLEIRFYHFDQAMGLARTPKGIAVGSRRQIWNLVGAPDIGRQVAPAGRYDAAFLTRSCHFTGPIMGHEMAWGRGQLWFVNTLFSCLCVADPEFHFVPRWKPSFITELAAQDRCHLNGLAMEAEEPRFVTVLGETNTPGGWRENKAAGGAIIDLRTNDVVLRGLCMPHSPRVYGEHLLFLDSGKGQVSRFDPASRSAVAVAQLRGYARGMDIHGRYAFVGLSRIRETSVFGGLPIAQQRSELRCGLAIIDLAQGEVAAFLHFHSGVEEVFEVKVLPGFRSPILSGPLPDVDETEPLWLSPPLTERAQPAKEE